MGHISLTHTINAKISGLLSPKRYIVDESVEKLLNSLGSNDQEIRNLGRELALHSLDTYCLKESVCAFSIISDYDSLTYCLNNLLSQFNTCFIFSLSSDGSASYIMGGKNQDLKSIVAELNKKFNGHGGGKPIYAQGKINGAKQDIIDFVNNCLTTVM